MAVAAQKFTPARLDPLARSTYRGPLPRHREMNARKVATHDH